MRTSKYIKLHTRCIAICEMIDRCNNFINSQIKWVLVEKARPWVMQNTLAIKEVENGIKKHSAIKERLTKWYSEIFERLQSETHEFRTPDWLKGIDTENIGTLKLTPEQEQQAENELLHDILGGVRYD